MFSTFRSLSLVLALGSCNPKICSFDVTPLGYCSTTKTIHVAWDTSHGDVTLETQLLAPLPKPSSCPKPADTTKPPLPPPETKAVDSSGSFDITPPQDMTLTLTVNKGERHPSLPRTVRLATQHPLNQATTRCEGPTGAEWAVTNPENVGAGSAAFDPKAHPVIISNKCDTSCPFDAHATCHRKIHVIHNPDHPDIDRDIEPDSAIDVSASGAAMTGNWILKGQLLPDEHCGTPSASTAGELDLNIEIGCAP